MQKQIVLLLSVIAIPLSAFTQGNDASYQEWLDSSVKANDRESIQRALSEAQNLLKFSSNVDPSMRGEFVAEQRSKISQLEAALQRFDRPEKPERKVAPTAVPKSEIRRSRSIPEPVPGYIPPEVANKLTEGDLKRKSRSWDNMSDQLKQTAGEEAIGKAVEYVLGEAAARAWARGTLVLGVLDPVEAADGTLDAKVKKWSARCDTYVDEWRKRESSLKEGVALTIATREKLATPVLAREERKMLQEKVRVLEDYINEEEELVKEAQPAIDWCRKYKEFASDFLYPQSSAATVKGIP